LCLASVANKEDRSIWAFDSFQGFPDPTQEDVSPRNAKKGEWYVRSLQEAEEQVRRFGLPPTFVNKKVRLIPGFVEETLLNNLPTDSIAFLHIDLDLYSAYKCTLEQLFPLVAEGGIVLFDEYRLLNWPGATLAVDEYFKDLPYTVLQHSSGKYFVRKTSK
jgi:O-methyltransferase